MIRYGPWWGGWRLLLRLNSQVLSASSSAPSSVGLSITPCSELSEEKQSKLTSDNSRPISKFTNLSAENEKPLVKTTIKIESRPKLVASAFAALEREQVQQKNTKPTLDELITTAKTVNALLSLSKSAQLTRTHAFKIISVLSDWTASKKVKLSDFECDSRFIKLCHLLGKNVSDSTDDTSGLGDLATVLGVTGDDEAAKLISSISLSQMVKVMSTLAQKKRRSTALLQALSSNICSSRKALDMKQAADILYAMAALNFPDNVLLEKVCADVCAGLEDNYRPAVVGSLLTSLGMLRYKDVVLLDAISEWVERNQSLCRVQDLVALLITLAKVNHHPANSDSLYKAVLTQVTEGDVPRPAAWLDVVWALAVRGQAEHSHFESVLGPGSVQKLIVTNGDNNGTGIPPAARVKLLNINAVAKYCTAGYEGPLLPSQLDELKVTSNRSREKQILVSSVMDSLSNLLPSATYLRTNIQTEMGFLIDGECALDSKCNPLPVEEPSVTESSKKKIRVAVLVWDYNDMCRGRQEPVGAAVMSTLLLEKIGYKVLAVPYTEFNPREKVVTRVRYLEQRLKTLARSVT